MKLTALQENCEHPNGFHSGLGWENRHEIGGQGETLEKIVVCKNCGLVAREIWIYSCTMIGDGKTL